MPKDQGGQVCASTGQRMDGWERVSFSPASHSFVAKVGEGETELTLLYPSPGEKGAEMVDSQAEGYQAEVKP